MEKKVKSHLELLKPAKLYLEDITNIVDIVKEVNTDVKISTDDYENINLNELENIKQETLNYLNISIQKPYLSLEFET